MLLLTHQRKSIMKPEKSYISIYGIFYFKSCANMAYFIVFLFYIEKKTKKEDDSMDEYVKARKEYLYQKKRVFKTIKKALLIYLKKNSNVIIGKTSLFVASVTFAFGSFYLMSVDVNMAGWFMLCAIICFVLIFVLKK